MKPILLLLLLTALLLPAEEKPLFNGKDLTGWIPVNIAPDTFRAEDGILITTGNPTGLLRTARMYENFIIEFDWRHMKEGGNSGLFVWADGLPAKGSPFGRGIECQILDPGFNAKGKNEWYSTHGDLFPVNGAEMTVAGKISPDGKRSFPSEERVKPSPEWNHYRLEAKDGDLALHVNGALTTIAKDISPRKGYLMFESEGSETHFRNIKITELPSTNPEPSEFAQDATGYRPIFTGLNFEGWKITQGLETAWKAGGGVLIGNCETGQSTVLTAEIPAAAYELVIDYLLPEKAKATIGGLELDLTAPGWQRHQVIVTFEDEINPDEHPGVEEGATISGVPHVPRFLEIRLQDQATLQLRNLFLRELNPDGTPKID